MSDTHGLLDGEKCNRNNCNGVMVESATGGCCSCHISPPCSYCENMEFRCDECDHTEEKPEPDNKESIHTPNKEGWYIRKTREQLFRELKENWSGKNIEYVDYTPNENYYFRIKKGFYPDDTKADDIKALFNLCFGYSYLTMKSGVFEIKYYTD
jgi:hypothetical protein